MDAGRSTRSTRRTRNEAGERDVAGGLHHRSWFSRHGRGRRIGGRHRSVPRAAPPIEVGSQVLERGVVRRAKIVVGLEPERLGQRRQDLGLLDGVDAEIRLELERRVEVLQVVPGLLCNHAQEGVQGS